MLRDLMAQNLTTSASQIGVDPFELVRMSVMRGQSLDRMEFRPAELDDLAAWGGVESWWDDTPMERHERVFGILERLSNDGYVEPTFTRLDNLWRGLSAEETGILESVVETLYDSGVLTTGAQEIGIGVAIAAQAVDRVNQMLSEGANGATLREWMQGASP